MLTKEDLQNLIACVEVAQKTGNIAAGAMLPVGAAYTKANALFQQMQPGDVLIVGTAKKNSLPEQSEEQSQKPAGNEPKPAKSK